MSKIWLDGIRLEIGEAARASIFIGRRRLFVFLGNSFIEKKMA